MADTIGWPMSYSDGRLCFPDGTEYSLAEADFLAERDDLTAEDIQAIHLIKKKFAGEITGATINGVDYAPKERPLPIQPTTRPDRPDHVYSMHDYDEDDGLDDLGSEMGETPRIVI